MSRKRKNKWSKSVAQAQDFIDRCKAMKQREKLEADQQTLAQKSEVAMTERSLFDDANVQHDQPAGHLKPMPETWQELLAKPRKLRGELRNYLANQNQSEGGSNEQPIASCRKPWWHTQSS